MSADERSDSRDGRTNAEHRSRLLHGMALALAGRSYAEVTIADIVREAAVSRRTFYEHFSSKADCLIALYEAASRNALGVLRSAIDPARDWQAQVELALGAYFECLAANPALLRTLFIEIHGLGREGLAARRRLNTEIAAFMREVVNAARPDAVSEQSALAVVGGIHELVLAAIERDPPTDLRELVRPASALVRAVAG
ncbi:MAG: TetR/AcrR family transcriptional regulator [Anaerolineae bacterium]|nr:TetR/AcrR family transcriptional regulator [Anaerolineae bacterium]